MYSVDYHRGISDEVWNEPFEIPEIFRSRSSTETSRKRQPTLNLVNICCPFGKTYDTENVLSSWDMSLLGYPYTWTIFVNMYSHLKKVNLRIGGEIKSFQSSKKNLHTKSIFRSYPWMLTCRMKTMALMKYQILSHQSHLHHHQFETKLIILLSPW